MKIGGYSGLSGIKHILGLSFNLLHTNSPSIVATTILLWDGLMLLSTTKTAWSVIPEPTIDGEFVCKRLKLKPRMCLMPDNPEYPPIFINNGQELEIVGTVTAAINKF